MTHLPCHHVDCYHSAPSRKRWESNSSHPPFTGYKAASKLLFYYAACGRTTDDSTVFFQSNCGWLLRLIGWPSVITLFRMAGVISMEWTLVLLLFSTSFLNRFAASSDFHVPRSCRPSFPCSITVQFSFSRLGSYSTEKFLPLLRSVVPTFAPHFFTYPFKNCGMVLS